MARRCDDQALFFDVMALKANQHCSMSWLPPDSDHSFSKQGSCDNQGLNLPLHTRDLQQLSIQGRKYSLYQSGVSNLNAARDLGVWFGKRWRPILRQAASLPMQSRQEFQPETTAITIANGCHDSHRVRSRKFNLNEIVKLHIDPGMQSHPALTQSRTPASHRNRRKPAARKDANPQLLRIPLPASAIRVRPSHLSNSKRRKHVAQIKTRIPKATDPKTIFRAPLRDGAP